MWAKVAREGIEGDLGAGEELAVLPQRRGPGDGQGRHRIAAFEAHLVALAAAVDLQLKPVREGVDHRNAHPVQAAGNLVGVLVEFSPGVELGHDHLGRRNPFALVDVGGDAAAVVGDRARAVGVEDHLDLGGVAGQGLVDGVVDHLIDHVVQARAVVGVADVHAGALAHRVQALEHLDRIRAIVGGGLGGGFRNGVFGVRRSSVVQDGQAGRVDVDAKGPTLEGFEQRLVRAGQQGLERQRLDLVEEGGAPDAIQMRRDFIQE